MPAAMPYEWDPPTAEGEKLRLWPHRSLPKRGFVWFMGATAALISLPLFAVLGTAVLWALLPFLAGAIALLWWALMRSYRDGEIIEELSLGPDIIRLVRTGPRGRIQEWQANPYWVRPGIYPAGGPVPNYLTLAGGGREVELGAFLTQGEREALYGELQRALGRPIA